MLDIFFALVIGVLGSFVGIIFLKNSNMDQKVKNKKAAKN